jgi:tRNA pseudouridine(55) synthase
MIYNLYKQRGETPLECIQRFAKATPELKGEKMTYMGRLDPMAEGVLLMASGEDVKRKQEFLGLDKEYDFIAIFGFATDSYDVLGKILRVEKLEGLSENDIRKVAQVYEGERDQEYPKYSSKVIASLTDKNSKKKIKLTKETHALFEDNFSEKGISENFSPKSITIHKIQFHGLDSLNHKELFGRLLMDISKVKGDFRQHEVLTLWKEILLGNANNMRCKCYLGRFSAHVSSGTYIRGIVDGMGKTLGLGATTLSIKRTRVGDYLIKDSIR